MFVSFQNSHFENIRPGVGDTVVFGDRALKEELYIIVILVGLNLQLDCCPHRHQLRDDHGKV